MARRKHGCVRLSTIAWLLVFAASLLLVNIFYTPSLGAGPLDAPKPLAPAVEVRGRAEGPPLRGAPAHVREAAKEAARPQEAGFLEKGPPRHEQETARPQEAAPLLDEVARPQEVVAPEKDPPHKQQVPAQDQPHFIGGYEDNTPRPPPRPKDSEVASTVIGVLPGADGDHLHGLLGRLDSGGPRFKTIPLPQKMSKDEMWKAHMGQCYNARKSDSLPLDRPQPDVRSSACRKRHGNYPRVAELPSASVVVVFHNEIASALLRSVHSVLNHSPPEVLVEVILVDDASVPDEGRFTKERWDDLQDKLKDYLLTLPKVRLVRLGERRGLMLARMEGAWRASGEVVVFLDSHIEATRGWIEPLLARIKENNRHVVVPSIDSIHFDNFRYEGGSGLGVLGFSWTLGQRPQSVDSPENGQLRKSPIMAGGLFAAHRGFFMHLGGYDAGMRFYGGEEMEIGFRTWQCGGEIEFVPCSHVYHIFRQAAFWQGTNSGGVAYKVPAMDITRNKLRTAAVWMDEYAKLVEYASPPLPGDTSLGDLEPRRRLRQKLECKSFKWYMENVATGMFVPQIQGLRAGALVNDALKACIDTMGGDSPGLYPCHWQHGTQGLVMDGDGLVRIPVKMYEQCLSVKKHSGRLQLRDCPGQGSKDQHWDFNPETGRFASRDGQSGCLEAIEKATSRSPVDVHLAPCQEGSRLQKWSWKDWERVKELSDHFMAASFTGLDGRHLEFTEQIVPMIMSLADPS